MKAVTHNTNNKSSSKNLLLIAILFCAFLLLLLHAVFFPDYSSPLPTTTSLSSSKLLSVSTTSSIISETTTTTKTPLTKISSTQPQPQKVSTTTTSIDPIEQEINSYYSSNHFPVHPALIETRKRTKVILKQLGNNNSNRTFKIFPKPRVYSRLAAVDTTAPDIAFVPRVTLRQCLTACDRHPRCNYVVRNVSFLTSTTTSAPSSFSSSSANMNTNDTAGCWLKVAVMLNTYPNFDKETWVVSKAPQPKIAIGLLSAPKFVSTRLVAAFSTWLKEEDVVVMLENTAEARQEVLTHFGKAASEGRPGPLLIGSDDGEEAKKSPHRLASRVLFIFEEEDKTSNPGAWKNLPLLKKLPFAYKMLMASSSSSTQSEHQDEENQEQEDTTAHNNNNQRHQDANEPDWYFVVDDDTFAIMRNIRFALAVALPYEPSYTGLLMAARDYTGGAHFIQGGAGIVLSQDTLVKTLPKIDCCNQLCQQKFGDFRTGCCVVQAAKAPGTMHKGFYPYSPWQNGDTDVRKRYGYPMFPLSFHRLREKQMIVSFQAHIDKFLKKSKLDKNNRKYAGGTSRFRMFPKSQELSSKYIQLREEDEKLQVPYNRREWSYVDDLVSQRVMKNLKPFSPMMLKTMPPMMPFSSNTILNLEQVSSITKNTKIIDGDEPQDEREDQILDQQIKLMDKKEQNFFEKKGLALG